MSAEEAEAQAEAEGLTLARADSQTGFVGVSINNSSNVKPFEARVRRNGKSVSLGHFATPEAAALNVARASADDPPSKRKAKGEGAARKKQQLTNVHAEVEANIVSSVEVQAHVGHIPEAAMQAGYVQAGYPGMAAGYVGMVPAAMPQPQIPMAAVAQPEMYAPAN